jgi:hypothetical protein
MLRNAASIVFGVVSAFVTVMLIDKLNHMIYPPPPGLDFTDPAAVEPYLATLPVGAFLLVMASSVVAAFIGTLVAIYVGKIRPLYCAVIVGGIVLAATIANFIAIPHPLWLSALTLLGIVATTWLATKLAPASRLTAMTDQ